MSLLKVKRLRPNAILPSKRDEDSGFDLYIADEDNSSDIIMMPGEGKLLKTGISVQVPTGYGFLIGNKGSVGSKGLVYGAHVVDSGYRGEVFIDMHNISDKIIIITDEESVESVAAKLDPVLDDRYFTLSYIISEGCYSEVMFIKKSKAIAQGMIIPTMHWEVEECDELDFSDRGEGALGSSGK